ncbi:MAG: hypothetical protein ACRCX8_06520 [Sarcina sp.]
MWIDIDDVKIIKNNVVRPMSIIKLLIMEEYVQQLKLRRSEIYEN